MPSPNPQFENGMVQTHLDLQTYRIEAAKKAAYRVADLCAVAFGGVEDQSLPLTFLFKPGTGEATALESVRCFYQELLDQDLRERIAEETAPIRTLILAQAFSRTDLIRGE